MADSREARFQQGIIEAMTAQGWKVGTASGYDCSSALFTEDLLGYVREAWPERWEKFCKANLQAPEKVFVQKVVRELERAGTLEEAEGDYGLTPVSDVGSGKSTTRRSSAWPRSSTGSTTSTAPRSATTTSCTSPTVSPTASNATRR
ncbi:hypothetical protein [Onishia niordana]|uniref:hypothetical protein n=1 Tax=Onishia niordana TaxID=2508711 RepID=UPI001F113214|nr:hypothetical protein [Halomonas niordiana]